MYITYMYMYVHTYIHVHVNVGWPIFILRCSEAVKNCEKKSSKHSPGIQVKKRANLDLSTASTRSSYAWKHTCAMSS